MATDRIGLRDAVQQRLLGNDVLADELQIDTFEGDAESDSGREEWFDHFLQAEHGGIAVSYAGLQEVDREGEDRTFEPIIILLLYARFEAAALKYLEEMEEALDGRKVVLGHDAHWAYWAADQMTGRSEGYYEYEVRIRIELD